jgi:hypothetical protein
MNTFPPEGDDDLFEPIQKQFDKQIEKVKADKEAPEKIKPEKEVPEKIKPEKEAKLEKREKEKREKEKREKESKIEVKEKIEKREKLEIKEAKLEIEKIKPEFEKLEKIEDPEKPIIETPGKQIAEGAGIPGGETINPAFDAETLMAHADSLEQSGRALRHFIERSLRPDLSTGALRNEPDQPDDGTDEITPKPKDSEE